jgi:DNA-binding MarR family transcriptional regulator/SAM-dependent methyltransferase
MLTKKEKSANRAEIFFHLDGIAIAPIAYTLHKKGVLAYILQKGEATLDELTAHFGANEGYLNIALRALSSQGWLLQNLDNAADAISYAATEAGREAFSLAPLYADVVRLLKISGNYHRRRFEKEPFIALKAIMDKYRSQYGLPPSENELRERVRRQILTHIEGILVGPTIVHLGMGGMFHKYFMEASFRAEEFHKDPESFREILDFLTYLGWFTEKNHTYRFTDKGLFFAQRAAAYGVTVSYIPTFRRLDELIFGNPGVLYDVPEGAPEIHVDREMNVWGSGGAHAAYFKKVDEIIISLFNRPIDEQPRGILDMGCGNGAFLKHIFEVVEQRTRRGEMLEDYPLFLVGADFNEAALRVTRANLIQADIWAKIIWGDIGRPDILAEDLRENYGIDLRDLLNVRTFLDHNRIWEDPAHPDPKRVSRSTGAFAHRGRRISNNLVEDGLLEHLRKWTPYVSKFGLLVIELHTLPPALAAANPGKTAVAAYDATHGFSDQYILELDVFRNIAAEAGLPPNERHFARFPDSELATVSINLLGGNLD